MKKLILTLAFGLFFVAFSNAQTTTETKKDTKATYSVQKEKTTATATTKSCAGKKAKGCCAGKKSCKGKANKSCAGKDKASCKGKANKSCGAGKAKATKKCGNGKCGSGKK